MITFFHDHHRPMARVVCEEEDCEEILEFPSGHGKARSVNRTSSTGAENLAKSKAIRRGWTFVKGILRCPSCEAKRKASPMKDDSPREPSKGQKREIMSLLSDVYDTENERYRQGDTDESVAEILDVMPGWVTQLREEFFGPAGGNEDMDALMLEIGALREEVTGNLEAAKAMIDRLAKNLERLNATEQALGRIKKAVGARTCRKASVPT